MPRRAYHSRMARLRAGDPPKGPWPAPVVDRIEPDVAMYAEAWPAWGYRKIAAIAAADGCDVGSASSVKRAMARRGVAAAGAISSERRQLAQARREAFITWDLRLVGSIRCAQSASHDLRGTLSSDTTRPISYA